MKLTLKGLHGGEHMNISEIEWAVLAIGDVFHSDNLICSVCQFTHARTSLET